MDIERTERRDLHVQHTVRVLTDGHYEEITASLWFTNGAGGCVFLRVPNKPAMGRCELLIAPGHLDAVIAVLQGVRAEMRP